MTRKKKRDEAEAAVSGAAGFGDAIGAPAPVSPRITPLDIQQRVFGKSKPTTRGYNEREVDQFLDDVTEELARQITENKSLREQLQRSEMRVTTPLGSDAADADAVVQHARAEAVRILADARDDAAHMVAEARGGAVSILDAARGEAGVSGGPAGAGDAASGGAGRDSGASAEAFAPDRDFIHREREFLQSLAGLIQGHAEAIREDLKRVRGSVESQGVSRVAPASEPPAATPSTDAAVAAAAAGEPATQARTETTDAEGDGGGEEEEEDEAEVEERSPDIGPPDAAVDTAETPVADTPDAGAPDVEDGAPIASGIEPPSDEVVPEPEPEKGSEEEPHHGVLDLASAEHDAELSLEPPRVVPHAEDHGPSASHGPVAEAAVGARGELGPSVFRQRGAGEREPAPPAGSFRRWLEETTSPSMEGDDEDERDRRSLRELFWGED